MDNLPRTNHTASTGKLFVLSEYKVSEANRHLPSRPLELNEGMHVSLLGREWITFQGLITQPALASCLCYQNTKYQPAPAAQRRICCLKTPRGLQRENYKLQNPLSCKSSSGLMPTSYCFERCQKEHSTVLSSLFSKSLRYARALHDAQH
jgi:hypothetical protein